MLKFLQDVIYAVTGKRGVTYETDFIKDLELTSFDIMNIVRECEDRLDMSIPTRDVWKLSQVKDVIAYMEKHGVVIK